MATVGKPAGKVGMKVETLSAEAAAQAGMEWEGLPAGQAGSTFIIQLVRK